MFIGAAMRSEATAAAEHKASRLNKLILNALSQSQIPPGQNDNARPIRNAAILRLQFRRLPAALALHGKSLPEPAENLPRELVP